MPACPSPECPPRFYSAKSCSPGKTQTDRHFLKPLLSQSRRAWVWGPAALLASCVTPSTSLALSEPQFPHVQNGNRNPAPRSVKRVNKTIRHARQIVGVQERATLSPPWMGQHLFRGQPPQLDRGLMLGHTGLRPSHWLFPRPSKLFPQMPMRFLPSLLPFQSGLQASPTDGKLWPPPPCRPCPVPISFSPQTIVPEHTGPWTHGLCLLSTSPTGLQQA